MQLEIGSSFLGIACVRNGGACEICSPQIAVLWLLAFAVVGAGAVVAYYLMQLGSSFASCHDLRNGMQSQAGTPLESSVAGFSLIAFVLQTTSVLGLMTVRPGGPSFQSH